MPEFAVEHIFFHMKYNSFAHLSPRRSNANALTPRNLNINPYIDPQEGIEATIPKSTWHNCQDYKPRTNSNRSSLSALGLLKTMHDVFHRADICGETSGRRCPLRKYSGMNRAMLSRQRNTAGTR